jgi:hypothetical protein
MRKLFNEIITENFPSHEIDFNFQVQDAYRTLNRLGRKGILHITLQLKCQV